MHRIEISGLKLVERNPQLNEMVSRLTPVPQEIAELHYSVVLDKGISFYYKGSDADEGINIPGEKPTKIKLYSKDWTKQTFIARVFRLLNQHLSEIGSKFTFQDSMVKYSDLGFETAISRTKIPDEKRYEAYKIEIIDDQLIIDSWTYRGLYYAFITLSQMLYADPQNPNEVVIPGLNIWDYPDFAIRGLVDDISRGQRPTLDNFKKFMRHLSMTKQNVLVLYIEDIFKYESHPEIGKGRGPLTKADIHELEEYAKDWFIEIQPAVEMFGHMENILLNPKYMDLAEFPGAQCFDVSNPKAKEFAKELLEEIAQAFQSDSFHLICDESFDFGLRRSRDYVKEKGWAEALTEWYLFLTETIVNAGKSFPTIAHDVIQKSKKALQLVKGKIPLILYWDYSNKRKYPKIDYLRNQGFAMAGSPAVFDWSRHFPYYDFAEINMLEMGRDGLQRGLIGLVTTKWGDFFNENFRENIYYGLSVNSQASWTPNKSVVKQIREGFVYHFYGTLDYEIMRNLDILSKQNIKLPTFPNGMFNRYWLDPFCREIKPAEHELAEKFIVEGIKVRKSIEDLKKNNIIKKNVDNLDFMDFSARMAIHFGVKILVSEAVYRKKPAMAETAMKKLGFDYGINSAALEGLKWLKQDIEDQREVYRGLWLRQAVPEGSEYPDRRFQWSAFYYQKAIEALEKGERPGMNQLHSEWIWRSGRRTSVDWGNGKWFYFYKGFSLTDDLRNKKVKKLTIQGIAASHFKIYLNGEYIGEVLSRMALSQLPPANSVQWFDVTSQIQENNMICIEAINWTYGIGGLNFIMHIEFDDGTSKDIISNKKWRWSEIKVPGWPFKEIQEARKFSFKKVRSYGRPPGAWQGPISVPLWDKGLKSSLSFVIGARNFLETSMPTQVSDFVYKTFFPLAPAVIKILRVDCIGYRKN